jgi:hypothetical protein
MATWSGLLTANAPAATGQAPWVALLMLAAGMALLAVVLWQSSRLVPTAPRAPRRAADEGEEIARDLIAELDRRADRLERLIEEADHRIEGMTRRHVAPAPANTERARREGDPMTRRIHLLADEGLPTVEIARRLEQPTGKVELILALRGR